MQVIEFLINNIYVVLIVLFLLSRLFAKPKSKGNKQGGMPDFGGGGGHVRPRHDSGPGGAGLDQPSSRQEGHAQRPWPGSIEPSGGDGQQQRPWPGSVGPSGGWPEAQSHPASMPQQKVYRSQLQTEPRPEREQSHSSEINRASGGDSRAMRIGGSITSSKVPETYGSRKVAGSRPAAVLGGKPSPEDMREAVLWAEVLGPPRSKRRLR